MTDAAIQMNPRTEENLSDRQRQILTAMRAGKRAEVDSLIERVGSRARGQYAEVLNDSTRTDEWKQQQLERIQESAMTAFDAELSKLTGPLTDTHRRDFGAVFGTDGVPGDAASLAISRRDAGDRVASVHSTGELLDLLERADLSGEKVLARAVARQAYELSDAKVLHRFLETRPALDAATEAVESPPRPRPGTRRLAQVRHEAHDAEARHGWPPGALTATLDRKDTDTPKMTPKDFQDHADRLAAMKQSFSVEAERISADTSLSPVGRQARLAQVWLGVAARLEEEMAAFDRRVAERREALERELYAPPTGASAADYRDALDRAERCDDESRARQLYERAQRTGDAVLAKAVATVGVGKGWTSVTSEFFMGSDAVGEASAELGTISRMLDDFNFQLTRGSAMQEAPRELGRLTRSQMRDLVDAA